MSMYKHHCTCNTIFLASHDQWIVHSDKTNMKITGYTQRHNDTVWSSLINMWNVTLADAAYLLIDAVLIDWTNNYNWTVLEWSLFLII